MLVHSERGNNRRVVNYTIQSIFPMAQINLIPLTHTHTHRQTASISPHRNNLIKYSLEIMIHVTRGVGGGAWIWYCGIPFDVILKWKPKHTTQYQLIYGIIINIILNFILALSAAMPLSHPTPTGHILSQTYYERGNHQQHHPSSPAPSKHLHITLQFYYINIIRPYFHL